MSIRKRPSKRSSKGYVYEVYFTKHGDRIYSKSGFLNKNDAKHHESEKMKELFDTGTIHKPTKLNLKQVYEEFLELGCNDYQYNTIYDTKKQFNKCLLKDIGVVPIVDFKYKFLQKYFDSLSNKGIEGNKNVKKALNRVLNYAIKTEYIPTNHLKYVTVKGKDIHKENDIVLSFDQLLFISQRLREKNEFNYFSYDIAMKIAYYTGMRKSEVLALKRKDIDFNKNIISINKKLNYSGLKKKDFYASHYLKSKKSKAIIPITNQLKKDLKDWLEMNKYEIVCADSQGNYLDPRILTREIKKVIKDTNIEFRFHMLRHSFSTNLYKNNVDIKTIQELMRHSKISTTLETYTHIEQSKKRETLDEVFDKNRNNIN